MFQQMFQEWDTLSEEERRTLFAVKVAQIEGRMAELTAMKDYLNALMPECVLKSGCSGGG